MNSDSRGNAPLTKNVYNITRLTYHNLFEVEEGDVGNFEKKQKKTKQNKKILIPSQQKLPEKKKEKEIDQVSCYYHSFD